MPTLHEPIKVIAGTYIGYTGCFMKETKHQYYVALNTTEGPITKRLNKESIKFTSGGAPATRDEAAFDQYPEIEQMMRSVTKLMAQCGIASDSSAALKLFRKTFKAAEAKQHASGRKANWKKVDFAKGGSKTPSLTSSGMNIHA